jgi:NAD(P)-dependent dehydrogenase (short-subunit alcohol dehydrogenase family)
MHTIVITGATGGLGSAVVPRLMREYRCFALYRDPRSFHELTAHAGPDLGGLASRDEVAAIAPVYGLVLLAGGFAAGSSPDDVHRMMETNFHPAVETIQAALPHLMDGGRIIAVSSAATESLPAGLAAYSASKAALNAYVETLAKDLAPRRITANLILPTALATPAMSGSGQPLVPLETVAEKILWLLSEGTAVTGQRLVMRA